MFDFENYPQLKDELERVKGHMKRLMVSENATMQEALDWVRESGGKMIRPTLTLLCSKLKRERTDATEIAAVIEICHSASLVHDDIIDASDFRRGRVSIQKKFGPAMAIYVGDYLLFISISRTGVIKKPWYKELFSDLEQICDGEMGQLDNRYNTEITEKEYLANISGKTAALFGMACSGGAYEGKLNKEEVAAAREYGRMTGIIFQLRDDLLDYLASSDEAKKSTQSDFRFGYYTLPAIHTFSHPEYGEELRQIAISGEATDEQVKEIITCAGGFEYTTELIRNYADKAVQALSIFRDSKAKRELLALVDYLVNTSLHSDFKER